MKVGEPIASMPTGYERWIPWTPVVGQRVRVRLRGECPYTANETNLDFMRAHEGCHTLGADGREGVVRSLDAQSFAHPMPHHIFKVTFTPMWETTRGVWIANGHYCETELEPLTEAER